MLKNKKGQGAFVWVILAVVVVIAMLFLLTPEEKTLQEHEEPADISEGESGTGMDITFYDSDGNEIEIPDWFATYAESDLGTYSIVKRTSPPSCSVGSDCAGYTSGGNIKCWNDECVLGDVASMAIAFTTTNPSSSELTFLDVGPISASPTAFDTALETTTVDLAPGESYTWASDAFSISGYEGTTQTFSVQVQGTNEFDGSDVSVGDSVSLVFETDPTGSLSVSMSSPVP